MKALKLGDLVKLKRAAIGARRMRGVTGIVIAIEQTSPPGSAGQLAKIKWPDYPARFYSARQDLILISEAV